MPAAQLRARVREHACRGGLVRVAATHETALALSGGDGELELTSEGPAISPYHFLAASLATCVYLVIEPWASRSGRDPSHLGIDVTWEHAEDGRVASMKVDLRWPGLSEESRRTVRRLAEACPIHRTLHEGTEIDVALTTGSEAASGKGEE